MIVKVISEVNSYRSVLSPRKVDFSKSILIHMKDL